MRLGRPFEIMELLGETPCRKAYRAFRYSESILLAFNVVDHLALRIVEVFGEIDGSNASDFELACSDVDGKRSVVVDLLACRYIDSTGLTALIKAQRHNALTLLLKPASRTYRIFEITELLSYFTVASSLDEVSAHLRGPKTASSALPENEPSLAYRL